VLVIYDKRGQENMKIKVEDLYKHLYEATRDEDDLEKILTTVADKLGITRNDLLIAIIKLEVDASVLYHSYIN